MKYQEMSDEQQDAFKGVLLMALTVKTQEEKAYTDQFFRLLMLANGTGIALLATFMGALIRNAEQITQLKTPMIVFLVGAFLAALVYLPLMTVANAATNNITTQVTDFFLNKKDIETVQGYGLSRAGRAVVMLLLFASLILFVIGVAMCIRILGRIP
jgi:glucan phosphoethanolaminetransferase (alkaline phosphatase superfamily)